MLKSTDGFFGVGRGRCSNLCLLDRSLFLRGAGMKAMAAGYLALLEQRHSFPSNRMGLREAPVSSKLPVTPCRQDNPYDQQRSSIHSYVKISDEWKLAC